MTIVYELSRKNLWEKTIKQMECMIVMLLICVNSAYKKKNYLGEEFTDPHVFYNRLTILFLLTDAYENQDEVGSEVSETWR